MINTYIYLHVIPVILHNYSQVVSNEVVDISVLEIIKGHVGEIVAGKVASVLVPCPPIVINTPLFRQLSDEIVVIPG